VQFVFGPSKSSLMTVVWQIFSNRWRELIGFSRRFGLGGAIMHMSNESLLVILFVGLVAGWLAGQIVRGAGFGLIGDLIIGIIGAFIGDWLLPQVGIHLGTGIVSAIINAAIGAVLLLLVIRLLRGGFGGGWGRRRWW
jgi:uncharacterized membrane protein YeaQ/YmgE (transglycosylase-associated protein family)